MNVKKFLENESKGSEQLDLLASIALILEIEQKRGRIYFPSGDRES